MLELRELEQSHRRNDAEEGAEQGEGANDDHSSAGSRHDAGEGEPTELFGRAIRAEQPECRPNDESGGAGGKTGETVLSEGLGAGGDQHAAETADEEEGERPQSLWSDRVNWIVGQGDGSNTDENREQDAGQDAKPGAEQSRHEDCPGGDGNHQFEQLLAPVG